jgi:hypothetical protein
MVSRGIFFQPISITFTTHNSTPFSSMFPGVKHHTSPAEPDDQYTGEPFLINSGGPCSIPSPEVQRRKRGIHSGRTQEIPRKNKPSFCKIPLCYSAEYGG